MAHPTALGQRMLAVNQNGELRKMLLPEAMRVVECSGAPIMDQSADTGAHGAAQRRREVTVKTVDGDRIKYEVALGEGDAAADAIRASLEARPRGVPPMPGQRWTPKGGWTGPGFDQPMPERPPAPLGGVSVGFVPVPIQNKKAPPGPLSMRTAPSHPLHVSLVADMLRDALAAADFGPTSFVTVEPSGHGFAAHVDVFVPPVRRASFEEAVAKVCKERGIDRAALSLTTASIPPSSDDRAQIVGLLWDRPDEATHIRGYHVVVTKAGPRADVSLASGRRVSFVAGFMRDVRQQHDQRAPVGFARDGAWVSLIEDSENHPDAGVVADLDGVTPEEAMRRMYYPDVGAAARLAVRVLGVEPLIPLKMPAFPHVALLPEQVRARRQQNVINGRAFLDDSVHACAGDARDLLLEFGQKKGARWERLRVEVANLVEVANTRPVPLPVSTWMLRQLAQLVADEDAAPSGPRPSPHRRLLDEAMCDARAA